MLRPYRITPLFACALFLGHASACALTRSPGTGSKHVLIIGIDGARSDAVQAANTPNLDALVGSGAVTWDAFAGGPPDAADPAHQGTSSGPGWSSMLTGVWADRHGVYNNGGFNSGDFAGFPHFFRRVRDSFPAATLSSIVQWHPINQSLLDPFPGLASFAQEVADSGQAVKNAAVAHLLSADPDALFLHFDDVDHAGHASGFTPQNPAYIQAIEETDAHIGSVIAALENRRNFATENWLILVSTDHGGNGTGHGGHTQGERTIWIIANGGGVANHTFPTGPGHTAVARTALHHLEVNVSPAWGLVDSLPFGFAAEIASEPSPLDGTQQAALDVQLDWLAGQNSTAQNVYFGTNPSPGPAQFKGSQPETSFDPGPLAESTAHFWRIDTVTSQGIKVGDVWSFETTGNLLDDLVLRLEFEGNVLDASGHSNHATTSGNPTFVAGTTGQGLAFDGNGDFLSLGAPADLDFGANTDFTVAFWIKSSGWGSDPSFLSNKDWVSGSNNGWIIAGESDGTSWQWNYRGASAARLDFDSIGPIADGAWHHLAVTHDRDGNAVFYQDGLVKGSISLAGTGNVNSGLSNAVGQDGTLNYPSDMDATLDDVGMWRRALGASEVQALMTGGFKAELGVSFCSGDNDCPCSNNDSSGDAGCENSTGSGASLSGSGSTSVAAGDLLLTAAGFPPNESGLFFMGASSTSPIAVGDGLACTGGLFRFVPSTTSSAGELALSGPTASAPSGQITPGDTRHFQAWTRDVLCGPPPSPCPSPCGNNSNLSNGYSVTFVP